MNDGEHQKHNEALAPGGADGAHQRARVLREKGELARRERNLTAARQFYEEAVALMRDSDDRLSFAHMIRHLGDVLTEQRCWPEAESCFIEALEIYRAHSQPHPLDIANAIRGYAVLKSETGPMDEARVLWGEAGSLYESLGIAAGAKECRRRAAPVLNQDFV